MLQLFKNEAITRVAREQMEIRQMELDWYTMNYDTMALQATMFAGFAFEQITEPVPEGTDMWMEVVYVTLTAVALGFELCVCMSCTFCCIFGKGLALRGPHGARSMHVAVDNLQKEQKLVFTQFVTGIMAYLLSHVIQMWIYFRPRIALTVSIPLIIFVLSIGYYVWHIVNALLLDDNRALTGQIAAWAPYERIQDLDEAIYKPIESKQMLYKSSRMTGGP
mmetsp:Transcript_120066/g.299502  ORF Transcript_120066/g.299502 Transcript_120066/m.299502 type:complete len:221 (-) Transcript_120066:26-688(-)|eukprot:CAMPEP_0115718590 /NCGR_PEP_ID=MMETSP0272-20121206/77508_1 /TAXON_ID=71861 /ORGANISM="Scrippsiella trochoidea, Strain CCMP3099" /LENGTH=220 /DNA_ID=CAMNT_0003161121 /DNA_START=104 /DNA_END=766 /DNA_ORIENTATION=+